MAVLDCNHPDLLEFIEAKHSKGRWNNFNVSVAVTDEFMRAVSEDTAWQLVHRAEPSPALRASSNEVRFQVTRGVTRPVWEPDAKGMALYETARDIAHGLGYAINSQSSGGGSDGNFTAALGVAPAYVRRAWVWKLVPGAPRTPATAGVSLSGGGKPSWVMIVSACPRSADSVAPCTWQEARIMGAMIQAAMP